MRRSRWMWWCAVVCWVVALIATGLPAYAQTDGGASAMQFSFGQVVVLCAVGMAWGDQRSRVDRLEKTLEKHMDSCEERRSHEQ